MSLIALARGFFLIVCSLSGSVPILLPVRPGRKRRPILVPPGGASVRVRRRSFRQPRAELPVSGPHLGAVRAWHFFHWCEPPMGASLSVLQGLISPERRKVFPAARALLLGRTPCRVAVWAPDPCGGHGPRPRGLPRHRPVPPGRSVGGRPAVVGLELPALQLIDPGTGRPTAAVAKLAQPGPG